MARVWVVRADFGRYADYFVTGGYVAIGWIPNESLAHVNSRDELYPLYRQTYPDDTSQIVVGQQVGQIARFLLDIQPGDFVITPAVDTEWLHYGSVGQGVSYYYDTVGDGCPFRHRRKVDWAPQRVKRSDFSVPFQNTIRSSLTVFGVSQAEEFLAKVGVKEAAAVPHRVDPYAVVLNQVLELDAKEFEILVGHLLTALGFEGAEVIGRAGDGGVDATGELNVANLAKIKVFVQAKRYSVDSIVRASVVRQLRQAIPFGGQGAFITTASYQADAADVALEPGFPRIGLINGRQLVDLLIEHWQSIPEEFRERLGLKPGLVLV